ncbi:thioredoxin [Candidatus Peribacteria bacterium RIFCSPLOWO2_12_FULL_55_15]|nr:MAG: thioredoxin [Candidatus Peribacteria bacterium RIFCSPHIGHO2_01_FULL_54_22]OGJ62641.1 MAG: thioredoxin [Candidatus Peribacteria bacterium RIFCSPHIGHO2_02_FULL_55_24]OGJ67959.1 MAG: thioredoxin [Candidatus Peribacteria bacterium RIFCSPLOWO2_01_FULL_54_110]OGJ70299.1 MAG: thioredoxin [Candidatus Peribacteria bacterium RIFCSPLOWO2_02_FULL_55_36]OGJ72273.1 MAG: thioredoxin [Candidatus Peribacteria bacterium RIFCSPLOWO2_12_FULL_55_15]
MVTPLLDTDFDKEVLKSQIPVLVDFWAPWCGPCKSMLHIMEELSTAYDGKAKIIKMNVDDNTETPAKFNVMSIPTFILFKDGKAVSTFIGVRSLEDIKKEIDAVME